MTENTTFLIVALKGTVDIEKDGHIIPIGNAASLETVIHLAAEKLALAGSPADITLENRVGEVLTQIDQIRGQHVVYASLREGIKEVIPGPRRLPYVGNLYDVLPDITAGFMRLFETYGPLIDVSILGNRVISTCQPEIAELFVKESEYFTKKISAGLAEIKAFGGQGLFTTDTDEDDWKLAHKLLMPAFSPRAVKAYQHEMGVIGQETIRLFEQFPPDKKIEILTYTTNLTFETIGRVGFGYPFHLLDEPDAPAHPFIEAMSYCLKQSFTRFKQMQFMKHLPTEANRQFDHGVKLMREIVDQVIQERKKSEFATDSARDLLGFMLNARDEHNLGLSDENIRDQVITFLIAGHDTTATTLAWTFYELSRNPEVEAKILREVADVGITHDQLPTAEQVSQLKYTHQVLKETLRMYPPVRVLGKFCKKDCVVPGGYRIKAGTPVSVHLYAMHRNPRVYPNPNVFDPDRWTPEEEQKRSRFAWLPFSTGPRGCIGMALALQEAKTVLAMLLHRFKLRYDGPPIQYDPTQVTTKPLDLFMTIHPRTDFPKPSKDLPKPALHETPEPAKPVMPQLAEPTKTGTVALPPITFLYGTQTGTAQDYASQLSNQARQFGFKDVTLCAMDSWKTLSTGVAQGSKNANEKELLVICTATYNGQPPDSAEHFDKFLDKATDASDSNLLHGYLYSVFGLGNKNWRTYQHFPIKVDAKLEELGAERFFTLGNGDADKDMDSEFNSWCAHFWSYTLSYFGLSISNDISVVPSSGQRSDANRSAKVTFIPPGEAERWKAASRNRNGDYNAKLLVNRELQSESSQRSTRHIEIDISKLQPVGDQCLYQSGDHLEIMPENSAEVVEAIALGFGFILDSVFEVDPESIEGLSPRSLAAAIKGPCTVRNALTYYADLLSPPSRRLLGYFASNLRKVAPETADLFETLTMPNAQNEDQYPAFIKKHRTLLDLQQAYPQVKQLDLGHFLTAVGVMQPRRYSIASSPLLCQTEAHLTVGVVDDLVNGRHYPGLSSSYLKNCTGELRAQLKSSKSSFSLPTDPTTPIILISAGTGLAPFRGFIQERAIQSKSQAVGECVVFFGCRHPDHDYIYKEELETFVKEGIVTGLHVAFSRQNSSTRRYVQHQLLANAADVWRLLVPTEGQKPASLYVCGSGAMSRDVRATFCTMAKSFGYASSDEEAEEFIQKLMDEKRYNEDVWG
ncbi:uncharacterized protein VTP21DRAFT_8943 [Calcarisporiella thermophila]|uniref:uncharacterized protein n=1 Tax=Calcarisporiella thermophila TaxID=911321 RepID=UPI003743EDD0